MKRNHCSMLLSSLQECFESLEAQESSQHQALVEAIKGIVNSKFDTHAVAIGRLRTNAAKRESQIELCIVMLEATSATQCDVPDGAGKPKKRNGRQRGEEYLLESRQLVHPGWVSFDVASGFVLLELVLAGVFCSKTHFCILTSWLSTLCLYGAWES